jgi:hypothetical protein
VEEIEAEEGESDSVLLALRPVEADEPEAEGSGKDKEEEAWRRVLRRVPRVEEEACGWEGVSITALWVPSRVEQEGEGLGGLFSTLVRVLLLGRRGRGEGDGGLPMYTLIYISNN